MEYLRKFLLNSMCHYLHANLFFKEAKCVGKSLRNLGEFSILSRCLTLSYFPVCWSFSWLSYENWLRLKSFPPHLMPMLDVSSILGHLVMILRIVGRGSSKFKISLIQK